jgi:hypothetical protein
MVIYAFLGRKRSGKDTAAKIVRDTINDNVVVKEMSFAEPIKDALIELTGSPREYFYEQEMKEETCIHFNNKSFTPRGLMTWYGNLMRDKFGNDFWVNKVKRRLQNVEHGIDYVFITDLRFLEETKMVDELGAKIIYMDRDAILGPMPENADISEKVVYESRAWAKNHAKDYHEISNHNNSIGYLTMHIRYSLKMKDI